MSDKPTPSEPNDIGIVIQLVLSVLFFSLGVHEITTQEADIVHKHSPTEHVTGSAAIFAGIWKLVVGVTLFGSGFYGFIRQLSDSPSGKSPPSSTKSNDKTDSLDDEQGLADYFGDVPSEIPPPSSAKNDEDAWRAIALELKLKFNPKGHQELHESLKRFHLATLGSDSTMTNLMYGQRDGTDIAVFEYEYTCARNNTLRQTVIWMQRRGTRLTEFALRPDDMWEQIGGWSGHGDINFDSHPDFSREYLLRGDNESAIRELFTDDVLNFYETHPELITEGEGNKLLFYREGSVVPPFGIPAFLEEALTVLSLFQPGP
jgi:hypothetical protein